MSKRIVFYIIDDSEQTSELMQNFINKVFPTMYVKLFNDGFAAWKSLEKEMMDVVVICEYNIQGITGLQLLKKMRSVDKYKDTYFIFVSGSNDREFLIKAIQAGVDDFLTKPIFLDHFLLKLKNTSKILNLQNKNSQLEEDYSKLKAEFETITARQYELYDYLQQIRAIDKQSEIKRIVAAATFIAKQLTNDAEEVKDIVQTAELIYVPKSLFKDKYIELPVMVNGIVENSNMYSYNEFVEKLFTGFRGFENTLEILNCLYENFDGSGIPQKLKAWTIPLGSRILRVISDFESYYVRNPKNVDRIIPIMWNEINRLYDFRVLTFYEQYLGYLNTMSGQVRRATEAVVNPYVLEKGMVLSRNIITISGLKLLNTGTKLDDDSIKKIQEAKSNEAYIGHIFVKIESIPVISSKKL